MKPLQYINNTYNDLEVQNDLGHLIHTGAGTGKVFTQSFFIPPKRHVVLHRGFEHPLQELLGYTVNALLGRFEEYGTDAWFIKVVAIVITEADGSVAPNVYLVCRDVRETNSYDWVMMLGNCNTYGLTGSQFLIKTEDMRGIMESDRTHFDIFKCIVNGMRINAVKYVPDNAVAGSKGIMEAKDALWGRIMDKVGYLQMKDGNMALDRDGWYSVC